MEQQDPMSKLREFLSRKEDIAKGAGWVLGFIVMVFAGLILYWWFFKREEREED